MKYSKKEHQYTATYCGEVTFSYENIYLYDVFGFCRVSLHQNQKHHMIVYPSKIEMNLLYNELSKPYENGLLQYQYRKGLDMSEIYDLKTYYPGDDIRHVHWKLSAKMQQMLLKEGTHHSSFEIVLLVDIGLNDQNEEVDKKVLSKALSFAMSMSEELLLKNIGHYVALYDHGSFYWLEMNNVQDYYTTLEQWFYKGVSLQNGDALHLFMSEQLDLIFTKMIYVTAGNFNEEISKLNQMDLANKVKNGGAEYIDIDGTQIELTSENLLVTMQGKEGFAFAGEGEIGVVLDTTITPELKEEGYVREILSKVQNMRKDKGFEVLDKINLYVSENQMLEELVKKFESEIKKETLTENVVFNTQRDTYTEVSINGERLLLDVEICQ